MSAKCHKQTCELGYFIRYSLQFTHGDFFCVPARGEGSSAKPIWAKPHGAKVGAALQADA